MEIGGDLADKKDDLLFKKTRDCAIVHVVRIHARAGERGGHIPACPRSALGSLAPRPDVG